MTAPRVLTVEGVQWVSLYDLFITFVKIGSVSFGGYMALISVIEKVIVERLGLIDHKDILDSISLANMLPGPMAVNVVAYVGYRLRGGMGAGVAVVGVLLPSFVLFLIFSDLYFRFGNIAVVQDVFKGFLPAISAIILSVAWRLGRRTIIVKRELLLAMMAAVGLLLSPMQFRIYATLLIMCISILIGYFLFRADVEPEPDRRPNGSSLTHMGIALAVLAIVVLAWFISPPLENDSLLLLMLTFASMSLMLFGGGYLFIPIIGSVVVLKYHWVSQQEFNDGIALGQITPGPILISVAFIGYKIQGLLGAVLSTVAIFAPPAVLMCAASRALTVIKRSRATLASFHAIRCAVIGMITTASYLLFKDVLPGSGAEIAHYWPMIAIFIGSFVAIVVLKLDIMWVILISGVLGFLGNGALTYANNFTSANLTIA